MPITLPNPADKRIPRSARLAVSLLVAGLTLVGCAQRPPADAGPNPPLREGPAPARQLDGPPSRPVDVSSISEPVVQVEPLSRYGNPPFYEIDGIRYEVLNTSHGFEEEGIASWYGSKFHGRRTSSGEIFDMYQFTAAHPTLPLPSFVEVTNLDNDQTLVVRVNDRGPFARNRVIDLSYAAAKRLGFSNRGTTPVHLRVITPTEGHSTAGTNPAPYRFSDESSRRERIYLQLGAFGDPANARALKRRLQSAGFGPIVLDQSTSGSNQLSRLRLGPLDSTAEADQISAQLEDHGTASVIVVLPGHDTPDSNPSDEASIP